MKEVEAIQAVLQSIIRYLNKTWSEYGIDKLNNLIEAAITKDTGDLLEAWEKITGENLWDEAIQDHRDDTGCRCGQ